MTRILLFRDLKKGCTLFQQHTGKQKGRGLDVEAEPHRKKHFLRALTRGTKLQSDKMHFGKQRLNYLICDKRSVLAKGLENWRYFFAISGGRMRCEL